MKRHSLSLLLSAVLALPLAAQANVIPGNWSSLTSVGTYGSLRAGSIWAPPPPLAAQFSMIDGSFRPEGTQWNNGSWWWDQDPSVNGTYAEPMGVRIDFNSAQAIDRFVVQADDNDSYQVDYWDGSAWQGIYNTGFAGGGGLRTRDSGILGAISTTSLRVYATAGDNYYALSEIQAFAPSSQVPEPNAAALVALGLGLAAWAGRRKTH